MGRRLAEIARPSLESDDWKEWLVMDLYGEEGSQYVSISVEYLKPGESERGFWHDSGVTVDIANIDDVIAGLRAAQSESPTRE